MGVNADRPSSVGCVCPCGRALASLDGVARMCECGRVWLITAMLLSGLHEKRNDWLPQEC